MLWFTGVLPTPFNREFTSAPSDDQANAVPCLPEGTPSVEHSAITVNVYNASNRTGLASSVSGQLIEQGITVSEQENWGGTEPGAPVVIYSAQNALDQAYTLARMFPSAVVLLDGTTETEVLDVVLGQSFGGLKPPEELAELAAGQELQNPEDCVIVDR
nr:LytR C-terminal domain-containing protein [Flaviflexus huanghaiensis]